MKLEGIHHVTCITGDAPGNVEFYAGELGLRMVKKTVNQDDPTVYHLFYADEKGSSGADITFFEYPGVPRGRAGDGMVHTIAFRVGSHDSLEFWQQRHRIRGFAGVRAYTSQPERSERLLRALGFLPGWDVRGDTRSGFYRYDPAPEQPGRQAAGTVHHVAFASQPAEHEAWRHAVIEGGGAPTPVIDRFYFKSIYFREPSGVLFEIATIGPGFTADEPFETLGRALSLPPNYERYREEVEKVLTPLPDPRSDRTRAAG